MKTMTRRGTLSFNTTQRDIKEESILGGFLRTLKKEGNEE